MPFNTNKTDAQFYETMHQLVKSLCRLERRSHKRKAFNTTQCIAPLQDDRPPQSEDFFEVRCRDISPKGFSFFITEKPDFDKLIIALQSHCETILAHAEVRHCSKALLFADSGRVKMLEVPTVVDKHCKADKNRPIKEKGTPMTLVGCRFTGRFA